MGGEERGRGRRKRRDRGSERQPGPRRRYARGAVSARVIGLPEVSQRGNEGGLLPEVSQRGKEGVERASHPVVLPDLCVDTLALLLLLNRRHEALYEDG